MMLRAVMDPSATYVKSYPREGMEHAHDWAKTTMAQILFLRPHSTVEKRSIYAWETVINYGVLCGTELAHAVSTLSGYSVEASCQGHFPGPKSDEERNLHHNVSIEQRNKRCQEFELAVCNFGEYSTVELLCAWGRRLVAECICYYLVGMDRLTGKLPQFLFQ